MAEGVIANAVYLDLEIGTEEYESEVEEECLPSGPFPGLEVLSWGGARIRLRVEVATGRVVDWPNDLPPKNINLKVSDGGVYVLRDAAGNEVARIDPGYVPHSLVPGEYGDYVDLSIEQGVITDWPGFDPAAVIEDFS